MVCFHTSIRSRWAEIDSLLALQSTLRATQKNRKDKKGKKKKDDEPSVSFANGPPPGEGSDGEAAAARDDISAPKTGVMVTPDDLADEEWGPVKEKGKKGKKGKDKKNKAEDEDGTTGAC
jgi:translation initiation factor 5B